MLEVSICKRAGCKGLLVLVACASNLVAPIPSKLVVEQLHIVASNEALAQNFHSASGYISLEGQVVPSKRPSVRVAGCAKSSPGLEMGCRVTCNRGP